MTLSRGSLTARSVRADASTRLARNRPKGPIVRRNAGRVLRGTAIAVVVFCSLIPLVWVLVASFKQNVDITNPEKLLFTPTLSNYSNVLVVNNFGEYALNSLFIAVMATFLSLVIGTPAAYVVAKYKMQSAAMFIFGARIIPAIGLLIPWYFIFVQMGLVGTFRALIASHIFVALPLVVAIMSSFFESRNVELEEAGQVDGLTAIGSFMRITLPIAIPGLATCAILGFIFSWNNFLFALVLSGQDTTTLPAAIFHFIGYLGVDWGGLMAAAVVITLPIMLIAMFLQRYIVAGMSAGATKG